MSVFRLIFLVEIFTENIRIRPYILIKESNGWTDLVL